jgi:hypothetical protein
MILENIGKTNKFMTKQFCYDWYDKPAQTRAVTQAKRFLKHAGIMKRKRMKVTNCLILFYIISNCDSVNLQNKSVTMTFEEGTWFLDTTECCHIR